MSKKFKSIFIIISIILAFATLAVVLYFVNRPRKNPSDIIGNTASNLYNGGTFCQHGNKVFFANSLDNDALYVMNLDESRPKKLVNNSVVSINADDNWLYYSLSGKSSGKGLGYVRRSVGMYSCSHDGTKTVCYTQNPVATLTLYGNNLYYHNYKKSEGTSLYSISINKTDDHQLFEQMVNPSCFANGYMYYSGLENDHHLYVMDPFTGAYSEIYPHDMYMPVYANDGYIYYLDPTEKYTLHKINPSTGEDIKIVSNRVDFFNVWNGYIYYQVSYGDSPALYRINTDGSGNTIIMEGVYKNLQTTDAYLYFRSYETESLTYHVKHGDNKAEVFSPMTK